MISSMFSLITQMIFNVTLLPSVSTVICENGARNEVVIKMLFDMDRKIPLLNIKAQF